MRAAHGKEFTVISGTWRGYGRSGGGRSGREAGSGQTKCDVFCFLEHFVFIVSQDACESRDIYL